MDLKAYIIDQADQLFCQYGFKSVTMDDIAKQLGISKKTIYQNFSDKDELVNILIEDRLSKHSCLMIDANKTSKNAIDEVFFMMRRMNESLASLNPKLFYDLKKYHPKAWINFSEFRRKAIYESIHKNLTRGIKEGVYRDDIHVDVLTQLRLDQMDLIFKQHDQYTMNKYTLGEIMVLLAEHFLYGICTPSGHRKIDAHRLKNQKLNVTQCN